MFLQRRLSGEPAFVGSRSAPAWGYGWPCCNCTPGCPNPCCAGLTGFNVTLAGVTNTEACTGCDRIFNRTWCFYGPYRILTDCRDYFINTAYWDLPINIGEFCGEFGHSNIGDVSAAMYIQCSPDDPDLRYVLVQFFVVGVLQVQYKLSFDDFDCNAESWELPIDTGTETICTNFPSTITLELGEDCSPPEPPEGCDCWPKELYSPRVRIIPTDNGTCDDCLCVSEIDLCFVPDVDPDVCIWRCDFSVTSGDPAECWTAATYAILDLSGGDDPDNAIISIYDVSDVLLAQFTYPLASFDCASGSQEFTASYSSDVCDWSTASCVLDMHGDTPCPTCSPCFPDSITAPNALTLAFEYDGDAYEFCMTNTSGTCGVLSSVILDGSADLYALLEFGANPASYARALIYRASDDELIGVYNYLPSPSLFSCTGGNTLNLATGNAGQCGYDIDVEGATELLSATATVNYDSTGSCFTCDPGVLLDSSSAGSGTIDTVAGCTYTFEGVAGGGAGHSGSTGNRSGGGGGGARMKTTWVSDGSTLSWTIGAGGTITGNDGNAGGDTFVGTLMRAKAGGGTSSNGTSPGAGGLVSAGIGDEGNDGGDGGLGSADDQGGGGGSSGGTSSNGNDGQNGDDAAPLPAAGGAAPTGGGAGGDGGLLSAGEDGHSPGGGGGGGDQNGGTNGGNGAAGRLIITCLGA